MRVWWDCVFSCLTFKSFEWFYVISQNPGNAKWPKVQVLLFPVKVQKLISPSDHKFGKSILFGHSTCAFNLTQKLLSLLDFMAY